MTMTHRKEIIAAGVLLSALLCATADGREIELAARYIDTRNGFSLRPPADSERVREISTMRLVAWRKHDEKTNAVVWTLTVMRVSEGKSQVDLNAYMKRLVDNLNRQERFRVEAAELVKLAGREAIDLSGATTGQMRFWSRQAWVQTDPGRFLVVRLTGPAGMKTQLNAICQSVLPTLEIIDPRLAQARREENLARGKALLDSLTEEKLNSALRTDPQWFLFRAGNEYSGFSKVAESRTDWNGRKGFMVRQWVWLGTKNPPLMGKRVTFATADRRVVRDASSAFRDIAGKLVCSNKAEVEKEDDLITCRISSAEPGRKSPVRKTKVPPGNVPFYVPDAMVGFIERLVDLSKPAGYAFAVYNVGADGFDVRTLAVAGPEKIEVDGKAVDAVRCTEQLAEDVDVGTVWLDAKGLRVHASQGTTTVTAATRDEVLKHFPKAEDIIGQMGE
jgi:hypothetical protein